MTTVRSSRLGAVPTAPFVLIHGFADSSATWAPLVPFLEPVAEVRCWDLPGHGSRVDAPPDLMSREAAVAELAEQTAALGAPAELVGHSLGGYLALTLAIKHPDLVASITLVSSGPGFRDADSRARWNQYMDKVAAKNGMGGSVAGLGHQPDSFVMDNLTAITCPLLHVLGAGDTRYAAGANYLAKVFPGSLLVTIPGAGHHPQVTHPANVAAAMLPGLAGMPETT